MKRIKIHKDVDQANCHRYTNRLKFKSVLNKKKNVETMYRRSLLINIRFNIFHPFQTYYSYLYASLNVKFVLHEKINSLSFKYRKKYLKLKELIFFWRTNLTFREVSL